MARTAEQQRQYMRDFRARKRAEQQESSGLRYGATSATPTPVVDTRVDAVDVSTRRDPHVQCDRRIAELEAAVAFHQARYESLLGACEAVYAACGRQGDQHQYTLYRDVVDRVREVVEQEVPF